MILSELANIVLCESFPGMGGPRSSSQQMQPALGPPRGPGGEISPDGTDQTGDPAEFMPLKKFYLIQRLQDLKCKIEDNGINNSDLNIILKFANELNYPTLLRLASPIIDMQLLQLQQNSKGSKDGNKS